MKQDLLGWVDTHSSQGHSEFFNLILLSYWNHQQAIITQM